MVSLHHKNPILSICIPTFNRDNFLENLFANLCGIKSTYGSEIEICVSNNHSTDRTAQVIDNWRDRLSLKVVTQQENIGASNNVIEVTRLASGKWIIIIGDDDEIIAINFNKLICFLESAEEGDWILVGVADRTGKELYLDNIKPGSYDSKSFRKIILRTGTSQFGFLGTHIFPSVLRPQFWGLKPQEYNFWPHVVLFLKHLQGYDNTMVFHIPSVKKSAVEDALFWYQGDWVKVKLSMLDAIAATRRVITKNRYFFYGLMIRDLYSAEHIIQLVRWRILEPREFHQKALNEYVDRYRLFGHFIFTVIPHFIFLIVTYITPHIVFRCLLRLMNHNMISKYNQRKKMLSCYDGFRR